MCEELRAQLHAMQQKLPSALATIQPTLDADAALPYNNTLFHLQSAREELRLLLKSLPPTQET
ncbi:MAG: hypothetical protein EP343_05565 [Deltaproteobacteria bacterium]|nr:MAG: hypothetical protein EP343_05565 [Deltaproteobacteria bacterium]